MSTHPRQLALVLGHGESYARDDFLSGLCNEAALRLIDCWPDWAANAVALIGPAGSGKTHLAMIWAEAAGARVVAGRNLTEAELPAALATGALLVEDAAAAEQRPLFHLINLAREEKAFLLLTARTPPSSWPVAIPDLVSRLRAMPLATLTAPDDAMLRAVIVKLAADRQLLLDEGAVTYLSTRIERSFAAARAAISALDNEALRQKRAPTRALAAELFRD
jgi:chromosomal replication initiation ATPase DnaA